MLNRKQRRNLTKGSKEEIEKKVINAQTAFKREVERFEERVQIKSKEMASGVISKELLPIINDVLRSTLNLSEDQIELFNAAFAEKFSSRSKELQSV